MLTYCYSFKESDIKRPFSATNKYIRSFERRHNFSTRRLHYKRRPSSDNAEILKFLAIIDHVFTIAERDHIVNVDETMWRCAQTNLATWAKKGSDGVVIYTGGNDKDSFTALGSITSSDKALPLILIAEGTTQMCESTWLGENRIVEMNNNEEEEIEKLPKPVFEETFSRVHDEDFFQPSSLTDHSAKGWTTRATWKRYLHSLRYKFINPLPRVDFYDQSNRIYLITDSYPVHNCQECLDYALSLNIEIIKIPNGMTDLLQPLDKKIFGILKAKGRSFIK